VSPNRKPRTTVVRNKSIISAIRPIKNTKQDWLGRQPFAEMLGKAILGWKERDSLVIALFGPWGSGKTSIKNLCVDYLRSDIEILEFNPWYFPNEDLLFREFFRELGIKANPFQTEAEKAAFASDIELYATLLEMAIPFIPVVAALSHPAIAAQAATLAVGAVASTATLSAGLAAMKYEKSLAEKQIQAGGAQLTVQELKDKLCRQLSQLEKPVLVVMDDIDRLQPTAIRLIFQLVKASADFPNLVYMLCFERQIITKSLTTEAFNGQDYLEKIIQVGFDIPFVSPELLHEKLEGEIKAVMQDQLLLAPV
jgi:predicted KAP-like P-loop ATPase